MNQELLKKVRPFLQWKLEKKQLQIDENQIARYANVTKSMAETVLEYLIIEHAVCIEIKTNCPKCLMSYLIDDLDKKIICTECGYEFIPMKNKHLLHYYYRLNDKSNFFDNCKKKGHPRQTLFHLARKTLGGDTLMEKKVKVFLSYCHVDEMYKEELDKHFAPLKRSNKVETWNDRELKAGTKFDDNIKSHLNQDDIIILLISSDFFASDYCYNIEMQRAIERANRRECILIPIIVRPCLWTETPIKDILALPKDGKPISKYEDKDEAYLEIVTAVSDMIDSFESE